MHKYFEINKKGVNIRCKVYLENKKDVDKAVIFFTGFAGHKDNNAAAKFADKLLSKHKRSALITFDWPAHGDDVKKKISLADCDTYLDLVVSETASMYPQAELFAYATSFGGYLLLKYIHEHGDPFKKAALRCPAVNMYDTLMRRIVSNNDMEKLAKGKDAAVGFDRKVVVTPSFLEELKALDIRKWDYLDYADDILIIHGTKDEVVPIQESKDFAENNIIEFVTVENADHRFQDPVLMSLANKHVLEFFGLA